MKNNKGFIGLGLILAIIAVLAIGSGAYYLGTKNDSVSKNVEENDYQLQEKSDWKVYRNEQYGFELKYPNDWVFSTFPNPDGFFFNDKSKDKFTFAILPKGEFDHGYGGEPILNDIQINGKQAKKMEWNNSVIYLFTDNTIPSNWIKCGLDLKSCNRIEIQGSDQLGQELIDQILSTFKFTINSSKTSENQNNNPKLEVLTGPFTDETNYVPPVPLISNIVWKIYKNQNFEIKYPSDWKIVYDTGFFAFDLPSNVNAWARFEIADSTPDINYWINDMENRKSPFTQKNIVIDGLPAKYVTYTNIEGIRSFYHVGNNEMGFRMFPSIGEKLKDPVGINKIEKIFEEMAYSFKFK